MPANFVKPIGQPTRITTTGISTIGAGLPVVMFGLYVPAQISARFLSFFTQSGAAVLTGIPVIGPTTMTANTFYPLPCYFQAGLTVLVTNDLCDLTIFWQPAD